MAKGRALDSARHSMLARRRARQARPPAGSGWFWGAAQRGESVAPVPSIDRDRERPQASLDPMFLLLSADLDRVIAVLEERLYCAVGMNSYHTGKNDHV